MSRKLKTFVTRQPSASTEMERKSTSSTVQGLKDFVTAFGCSHEEDRSKALTACKPSVYLIPLYVQNYTAVPNAEGQICPQVWLLPRVLWGIGPASSKSNEVPCPSEVQKLISLF